MSGVERTRIDTEKNLLDVLDKVHEITDEAIDADARLHALPGLRGPAAEDGREGLRRRPVLHAARSHPRDGASRRRRRSARRSTTPAAAPAVSSPRPYEYMEPQAWRQDLPDRHRRGCKHETFWGREKENLIYPDRPGEPGPARHRPAEHLARQHADRRRGLRRPVRRRARRSSTSS